MPSKSVKDALSLASAIEKDVELLGLTLRPKVDWVTLFDILVVEEPLRSTTRRLFVNGHYAQAIEEAYKCLNNQVKQKTGMPSNDGVPLMENVFSPKSPKLKINNLTTLSEKDEQEGYMRIFAGCMKGIRNPRAHAHNYPDDPKTALELLTFANHLFRVVRVAQP